MFGFYIKFYLFLNFSLAIPYSMSLR